MKAKFRCEYVGREMEPVDSFDVHIFDQIVNT